MALTGKKYEELYVTSGGGANDVSSIVSKVENIFDAERSDGMKYYLEHPDFSPFVFAIKQLQEEVDYLRTEISNNKDKTGITNSQASAITANTAKTGITTQQAKDISDNKTNISTNTANIANKLKISTVPIVSPGVEQGVECAVVYDSKAKTYSMVFAYLETTTPKGGKATTVARTGSIQLK